MPRAFSPRSSAKWTRWKQRPPPFRRTTTCRGSRPRTTLRSYLGDSELVSMWVTDRDGLGQDPSGNVQDFSGVEIVNKALLGQAGWSAATAGALHRSGHVLRLRPPCAAPPTRHFRRSRGAAHHRTAERHRKPLQLRRHGLHCRPPSRTAWSRLQPVSGHPPGGPSEFLGVLRSRFLHPRGQPARPHGGRRRGPVLLPFPLPGRVASCYVRLGVGDWYLFQDVPRAL